MRDESNRNTDNSAHLIDESSAAVKDTSNPVQVISTKRREVQRCRTEPRVPGAALAPDRSADAPHSRWTTQRNRALPPMTVMNDCSESALPASCRFGQADNKYRRFHISAWRDHSGMAGNALIINRPLPISAYIVFQMIATQFGAHA